MIFWLIFVLPYLTVCNNIEIIFDDYTSSTYFGKQILSKFEKLKKKKKKKVFMWV